MGGCLGVWGVMGWMNDWLFGWVGGGGGGGGVMGWMGDWLLGGCGGVMWWMSDWPPTQTPTHPITLPPST